MSKDEIEVLQRACLSEIMRKDYKGTYLTEQNRKNKGLSLVITWEDFMSFCLMLDKGYLLNRPKQKFYVNTKDIGVEI